MNTDRFNRKSCFGAGPVSTGMTLVEVVAATGIFIVIMLAVALFQMDVFKNEKTIGASLETTQRAGVILKTIAKELRAVGPGGDGMYPVISAYDDTLVFFSDTNDDGTHEKIRYSLVNGTLYRGVTNPTGFPPAYDPSTEVQTVILTNIINDTSTPLFEYFDGSYDGTSEPMGVPVDVMRVRMVKTSLAIDINPELSPEPRIYSIQTTLRNLKDNL